MGTKAQVQPPGVAEASNLPAVPDSPTEPDFSSDEQEAKVKVRRLSRLDWQSPCSRPRHRTSDSREDAREEREKRAERRERQQAVQRSPSVREPRPKESRPRTWLAPLLRWMQGWP